MSATMIPDDDLMATAGVVTVWVATPGAPTDMWSLTEAIAWALQQPNRHSICLFRAPGDGQRVAWVKWDQIERLALHLGLDDVSSAA